MKRSSLLVGAVLAAATLVAALPLAAGAAGSTCTGALAPGDYNHLVVPAGAVCIGALPVPSSRHNTATAAGNLSFFM